MKVNGQKTQELQMDLVALLKAYDDNYRKEEELIRWVNPQTNKVYDRRVLAKAAARRCQDKMEKIRQRAFWRKHEQAPPDVEGNYYLPDHAGELDLLPEEAKVIAHYEAKIRELDAKLAETERVMNGTWAWFEESVITNDQRPRTHRAGEAGDPGSQPQDVLASYRPLYG
jgi:hypothetical protein